MQPYSAIHLRQNLASQPQVSSQPPNATSTTGHSIHRLPDVHPNTSMLDLKGKRREADSASSRTKFDVISENLRTNEKHGLGSTGSSRSTGPTPSVNVPLSSGTSNSTANIYRRPEPPPQYSYPFHYHYTTPPSKSTHIPKVTIDYPSLGRDQPEHYTSVGSPSKSLGSIVPLTPSTPSQSHLLPQASPTVSLQRPRSRDYTGTTDNATGRRRNQIAPLTSDARTEHILLAARRIGRERASLVAGIRQHAEREKEVHARELELIKARQDLERSEKERLERLANGTSGLAYYRSTGMPTTPQQQNTGKGSAPASVLRTPKRGGVPRTTHYSGVSGSLSNSPILSPSRVLTPAGPSTFVFVNTSADGGTPAYSGGILSTPGQIGSVHKRGGTPRGGPRNLPSNPPTPLDSLLDAARMIDDGAGGKAGGKINGTRKASEHPESPVPKRRRVSSRTVGRGGEVAGASTVTRVRSALDVLADQAAAAFDEPDQTKGKGMERLGDEEVDNVQEGDDVDGSWAWASTPASAFISSVGPSRGSRAKSASTNTQPITEPTSTSLMSLRPVRQASQKRLASQDLQPSPSISTTRGKGKSRGRPKGSKSVPHSAVSTSKINPSLGPRIISLATTHSPLDKAIALLPREDRSLEKERNEEHSPWKPVDLGRSPGTGSPRLGLRPVMEWAEGGAEDGGDEEMQGEGEGEYVPSVVTGGREPGLGEQNGCVEGKIDTDVVDAGSNKVTTRSTPSKAESVPTQIIVPDMEDAEMQIDGSSNSPTNESLSPADADLLTTPLTNDINDNAEADINDEDAEGEQEEENDENTDAEAGYDRSSRSRTPPPPDPPHPGSPSNSNDDPDADADAEGETEFENEELLPTSTNSAMSRTALSMPMDQVLPANFNGSFSKDDVWLIQVFWMKLDKSFGYNMTCIHVFIPVMVPRKSPIITANIFQPIGRDIGSSPEGCRQMFV